MTCGIYLLKFNGTDMVYIGQSLNIEKRFSIHRSNMKCGTSSIPLNSAYNTYGEPRLEILCECLEEELDENENMAIDLFDSTIKGFNTKDRSGYRAHIYKEQNPNANITKEEAKNILNLLVSSPELSQKDISDILDVPIHTIRDISAGITFLWLKEVMPEEYKLLEAQRYVGRNTCELNPSSVFTKESIIKAFNLLVDNKAVPITKIAKISEVSYSTLKSIANGVNHKWLSKEFPDRYNLLMSYRGERSLSAGKDAESKGKKYLPIISPEGGVYTVTNIAAFAREHNLNSTHIGRVLRGLTIQHKGWRLA